MILSTSIIDIFEQIQNNLFDTELLVCGNLPRELSKDFDSFARKRLRARTYIGFE